jgi:CHASE3 domain sensor protein
MSADATVLRRTLALNRSGEGERRWPLARIFTVAATVAALVAITGVTLGGFALARLADARTALLDVAGPSVVAAQELSGALVNQETGVRGFGITGRDEFLDPYRMGIDGERTSAATLRALAAAGGFDRVVLDTDTV